MGVWGLWLVLSIVFLFGATLCVVYIYDRRVWALRFLRLQSVYVFYFHAVYMFLEYRKSKHYKDESLGLFAYIRRLQASLDAYYTEDTEDTEDFTHG